MKQVKIDDLLLLRLWRAGDKGMAADEVRKDIGSLFPIELNAEMLNSTCDGLAGAGLLSRSAKKKTRYKITPAGQERARALLRVTKTGNWRSVLAAYCLELSGLSKDAIRIAVLRELCVLPEKTTLLKAVDVFLRHHMAQPGAKEIEDAVIRRALGVSRQEQKPQSEQRPQPLDLNQFAQTVIAAARHTSDGRVGNKVFISRVWKEIQNEGRFAGMTFEAFKGRLVEANHQRLLSLSRADLAPFMDQQDVLASEIKHMDATFHFLVTE